MADRPTVYPEETTGQRGFVGDTPEQKGFVSEPNESARGCDFDDSSYDEQGVDDLIEGDAITFEYMNNRHKGLLFECNGSLQIVSHFGHTGLY